MKTLTMNSRIKDIYRTPIGFDIINKILLQNGKSAKLVTNPIVSNLRLKTISSLVKDKLGPSFFETLLELINSEKDTPMDLKIANQMDIKRQWWKEAVFYQIYPRTFCDSNGDGIGDLAGIISKLDYLKKLGIDALWLSPIYDSPMDDNGYDIRDYQKILKEFGTMKNFDTLLKEVHKRGMRLIMDLVVNHTSDEHKWFKTALKDRGSRERSFYFFRQSPNNWTSFFSGSAWNKYDNGYALHLFSKKQMDLNWDNPDLRNEVIKMINWWLEKGVDGFRMDVINYISKQPNLPDGDELIGQMMGFTGIEHYFYGPNLHKYLNQIKTQSFKLHDAFSVGETPGLGMKMARLVTGEERNELDMIFNFDQLETPGHTRFDDYEYDLNYYRDYIVNWSKNYGNNCWMSLFYNNHDNPRMVSKVCLDRQYQEKIEILLAVMQMTLKGTPFIFQGDEIGLANYNFTSIEQINDVESRNLYQELLKKMDEKQAFGIIKAGTRDHARILLPWNTESKNPLVSSQKENLNILEVYKNLIKLRHENSVLVYGDFEVLNSKKDRFTYSRKDKDGNEFIVDCNLGKREEKAWKVPKNFTRFYLTEDFTFSEGIPSETLSAYEVRVYRKN